MRWCPGRSVALLLAASASSAGSESVAICTDAALPPHCMQHESFYRQTCERCHLSLCLPEIGEVNPLEVAALDVILLYHALQYDRPLLEGAEVCMQALGAALIIWFMYDTGIHYNPLMIGIDIVGRNVTWNSVDTLADHATRVLEEAYGQSGGSISLAPFPFEAKYVRMFRMFEVSNIRTCMPHLTAQWKNKESFKPKLTPKTGLGGNCPIRRTPFQRTEMCRSVFQKTIPLLRRTPPRWLNSTICPFRHLGMSEETEVQVSDDIIRAEKYSTRSCDSKSGMWQKDISAALKCIAFTVSEYLRFRPGDVVLDWGCGCGWFLTWATRSYGIFGVGLDIEREVIKWAREYSFGTYCLTFNNDLSWIPPNSVDHIVSYWATMHLTKKNQCDVALQMYSKLVVGGNIWIGGNNPSSKLQLAESSKMFTEDDYFRCFSDLLSVSGPRMAQLEFIFDEEFFQAGMPGDIKYMWWYPAFSVIITKVKEHSSAK